MTRLLRALAAPALLLLAGCAAKSTPPPLAAAPPPIEESAPPAPAFGWRAIPLSDSRLVAQEPRRVESLDALVTEAIHEALAEFEQQTVTPETIWGTVIDCRDSRDPRIGSYNGSDPVYPASVVKTCYMVAAFDQNRTRGLPLDEAMRTDLARMIGPSDNAATNRILDKLANTGYGPSLQGEARDSFEHKRQIVHRYMSDLGLGGLWAVNKTYATGIPLYGREVDFLGSRRGGNYERSNMMTTDDTARLLYLLWRRAVVDPPACEEMLDLMRRGEGRSRTYFSSVTPEGATLYAKSGGTNVQRHDAGIFALPDGTAVIVVMFSNHSNVQGGNYPQYIQRAAEIALERLLATPGELDHATADPDPTVRTN